MLRVQASNKIWLLYLLFTGAFSMIRAADMPEAQETCLLKTILESMDWPAILSDLCQRSTAEKQRLDELCDNINTGEDFMRELQFYTKRVNQVPIFILFLVLNRSACSTMIPLLTTNATVEQNCKQLVENAIISLVYEDVFHWVNPLIDISRIAHQFLGRYLDCIKQSNLTLLIDELIARAMETLRLNMKGKGPTEESTSAAILGYEAQLINSADIIVQELKAYWEEMTAKAVAEIIKGDDIRYAAMNIHAYLKELTRIIALIDAQNRTIMRSQNACISILNTAPLDELTRIFRESYNNTCMYNFLVVRRQECDAPAKQLFAVHSLEVSINNLEACTIFNFGVANGGGHAIIDNLLKINVHDNSELKCCTEACTSRICEIKRTLKAIYKQCQELNKSILVPLVINKILLYQEKEMNEDVLPNPKEIETVNISSIALDFALCTDMLFVYTKELLSAINNPGSALSQKVQKWQQSLFRYMDGGAIRIANSKYYVDDTSKTA